MPRRKKTIGAAPNPGPPNGQPALVIDDRLKMLTPSMVTSLSYAVYVCSLPRKGNGKVLALARERVAWFEELCDAHDRLTPEGCFLNLIGLIVVSRARGLIRRRHEYQERKDSAEAEKKDQLDLINQTSRQSALFSAGVKAILLGGVAFFLGEALLPFWKKMGTHDPTYLSLAAGVGMTLITSYFRGIIMQFRLLRIFALYRWSLDRALIEHLNGQKREHELARDEVAELWQTHLGCKAPMGLDFGHVMDDDIDFCITVSSEREKFIMSYYQSAALKLLDAMRWAKTLVKRKRNVHPPAPSAH